MSYHTNLLLFRQQLQASVKMMPILQHSCLKELLDKETEFLDLRWMKGFLSSPVSCRDCKMAYIVSQDQSDKHFASLGITSMMLQAPKILQCMPRAICLNASGCCRRLKEPRELPSLEERWTWKEVLLWHLQQLQRSSRKVT